MSVQYPNQSQNPKNPTRPRRSATVDVHIVHHGSIVLCHLYSRRASRWVEEHVSEEAQFFGMALVVEPRYIEALVAGMSQDGLEVR